MKRLSLFFVIFLGINITACDSNNCGKTTYRPEVGVGYVFRYDADGNALHPIEGATITVKSIYTTPGMFGKFQELPEESFITDADGRYQVRFVERGCWTNSKGKKETIYCNLYVFYCRLLITGEPFRHNDTSIKNNSQNNILLLDTIKIK